MGGCAFINGIKEDITDNFYPCKFSYRGYEWTSVEQAYQGMKFSDKNHIKMIQSETEISIIYFLGNCKYIEKSESWNKDPIKEKLKLMYEISKEKYLQNNHLRKILIESIGDIEFRGDRFWGKKGTKWCNHGGKILERIRDELRDM